MVFTTVSELITIKVLIKFCYYNFFTTLSHSPIYYSHSMRLQRVFALLCFRQIEKTSARLFNDCPMLKRRMFNSLNKCKKIQSSFSKHGTFTSPFSGPVCSLKAEILSRAVLQDMPRMSVATWMSLTFSSFLGGLTCSFNNHSKYSFQ